MDKGVWDKICYNQSYLRKSLSSMQELLFFPKRKEFPWQQIKGSKFTLFRVDPFLEGA